MTADYSDGIACLFKGDCRDILGGIVRECSNPIIVTDPPFNVGYGYATYKDRMDEGEYFSMLADIFGQCPSVVVHYPEPLYKLAMRLGEAPERVVSWVYNSNTARQHRDAAYFGIAPDLSRMRQPYKNPNDKRIRERAEKTGGGRMYDWQYSDQVKNVSKAKTPHPCQMPLVIMRYLVGVLPLECDVIDPFMGSGTTGVSVLDLNRTQPGACRRFIGIEMDAGYFEIARNRISSESAKRCLTAWEAAA